MGQKLQGGPERCDLPQVGTRYGYTIHMRKRKTDKTHIPCDACRLAAAESQQDLVKRRLLNGGRMVARKNGTHHHQLSGGHVLVDACGTRRRLQALCAIGYSWKQIGDKLGMNRANVAQHAKLTTKVWPRNAEKARALYEELSMIPARHDGTKNLAIARFVSAKYGYVSPLGWDDETIDDPYALPMGLTHRQEYAWFWGAATMQERIEYVLEHGLSVTRANEKK